MACRFEYKGKTYTQDELAKELEKMLPNEASKYIPEVQSLPNMPMKKTWDELTIKRMIKEAADNGYDAISWTPGEAQAARYDLSKQVDTIHAFKKSDGNFDLSGIGKDGRSLNFGSGISPDKLSDVVGKELAEKIINQKSESKNYSGLDLKVGGEGMKAFYDKMMVDKVNQIAKKFGGKVETKEIPISTKEKLKDIEGMSSFEAAEYMKQNKNKGQPIHVLKLTPKLKKVATEKGFPLFSETSKVGAPLSALERASKQGFTTEAYHGTGGFEGTKIKKLNEDEFYATSNAEEANMWATAHGEVNPASNSAVLPLRLNTQDYHVVDVAAKGGKYHKIQNEAAEEALKLGKKGVIFKNATESDNLKPETIYMIFDPSTVRSRFAQFKPENVGKSGLLLSSGLQFPKPLEQPTFDERWRERVP